MKIDEFDIHVQSTGNGYYDVLIRKPLTKEEANQLKQQILTALEQYPKLQNRIDELIKKIQDDSFSSFQINEKLKAENEELRKRLQNV
ncbi:MAG TPA: hypothetical protein VM577_14705 [Anaerovoracaceae bacterium]|nr:hypothetical protein [Anaerovoracaceae bacterium]